MPIALQDLAYGAFMEQFERELDLVLRNIADPNTDAKAPRKVTMTVTLKPNEERNTVSFAVQSKASLVAPKPVTTTLIIGREDSGKVVAAELKSGQPGQMYIDADSQVKDDTGNVVQIKAAK